MLFSAPDFLFVFLPAVLTAFLVVRRSAGIRAALTLLALASVIFYAMWKPEYVPVFLGSVLFNALIARFVGPGLPRNRAFLALGIAGNLGLLFWFKYARFAFGQLVATGLAQSSPGAEAILPKVLPLAISFYTFQQIAYLVDVSRGDSPRASLLKHLLFVSFFPHLIAGPITHPRIILPQLDQARPTWNGAALGLFVFSIGLAKKVVLADPLGRYVDPGFANPEALAQVNAWATVLAYTMQLYFDFSGYSDMAVGLGLFFGVRLPWNFLSPYKSRNISEFWRRWHITLSDFLKTYLFIPLGGSRRGRWRTAANLLIVMLLGGIWHGAGWTYVMWGLLHGSALAVFHLARPYVRPLPAPAARLTTMGIVVAGWVLFRSAGLEKAGTMYQRLAGRGARWFDEADRGLYRALPYLLLAVLISRLAPNSAELAERFTRGRWLRLWGAMMLALSMLYVLGQVKPPEFLYFDF
jgi:alginate O-acetyltransferase complex protein AlgI